MLLFYLTVSIAFALEYIVLNHRVSWSEAAKACWKNGYELAKTAPPPTLTTRLDTFKPKQRSFWMGGAKSSRHRRPAAIVEVKEGRKSVVRAEPDLEDLKLPVLCQAKGTHKKDVFMQEDRQVWCQSPRQVCHLRKDGHPRCKHLCPIGCDLLGTHPAGIGANRHTHLLHGSKQVSRHKLLKK